MLTSDDIMAQANSTKVLVFLEDAPLTDRFEQIILTPAQAQKVRDAIVLALNPNYDLTKEDPFEISTNNKVVVTLPDVLAEYEPDQIKALEEAE